MKKLAIALLALAFVLGTTLAASAQTSGQYGTSSSPQSQYGTTQHGTLDKKDMKFLQDTAKDNALEIQASQIAAQRASSPEVRDFAQKVLKEHTQLGSDLQNLASSKGITLSSSLERKDQKELDKLEKYSGDKFDKEYMKFMVKNHKEDVRDFQSQAKNAKDSDVQSWASKHISSLQDHLKMAQDMKKHIG